MTLRAWPILKGTLITASIDSDVLVDCSCDIDGDGEGYAVELAQCILLSKVHPADLARFQGEELAIPNYLLYLNGTPAPSK